MDSIDFSRDMMAFIDQSKTAYHAALTGAQLLEKNGFCRLLPETPWSLSPGGRYYINYGSALAAFILRSFDGPIRIVASHTDSPAITIKPDAIMPDTAYIRANTEVYGGPILHTWLDRPLGIAGKVFLKTGDPFMPEEMLFDSRRSVAVIPSLAIHLNREVNKGYEIDRQKELLPLLALGGEKADAGFLKGYLADSLQVDSGRIQSYSLQLYDTSGCCFVGVHEEMISGPRLDNLVMLHASLLGLLESDSKEGIDLVISFDNEEVGSLSRLGADSRILDALIGRIHALGGVSEEKRDIALSASFMISADAAHGLHPNYREKHDPTNHPLLNGGPVIKGSVNRRYTTEGRSEAIFRSLCEEAGVPVQMFVNHSSSVGGSTIGPISSSHVSVPSIDVGTPMLSMHSIRELVGREDAFYMKKVFASFFAGYRPGALR